MADEERSDAESTMYFEKLDKKNIPGASLSKKPDMYVKIQRHQPCISKYISDLTLYLFQILNIRNCVLYGDIAATKICSSIERFGGFKIDSDKTKLPPSSGT